MKMPARGGMNAYDRISRDGGDPHATRQWRAWVAVDLAGSRPAARTVRAVHILRGVRSIRPRRRRRRAEDAVRTINVLDRVEHRAQRPAGRLVHQEDAIGTVHVLRGVLGSLTTAAIEHGISGASARHDIVHPTHAGN